MNIEELGDLKIEQTLCLGTKLSMPVSKILAYMTKEQVIRMFYENSDVQYILLDSQGRS